MPSLRGVGWLLVDSGLMAASSAARSLRLILERVAAQEIHVALDLNWQPQGWCRPAGSPPTAEVLRRMDTLTQAASLIRLTLEEAEWFFGSTAPRRIHQALPQHPAVLVDGSPEALRWGLGAAAGS